MKWISRSSDFMFWGGREVVRRPASTDVSILGMLEYAWGIRQEKRSSSFQVILTKFLMLHVDLILILKLILKVRKRKRFFRTEVNYTNHTTTTPTSPTLLFKISFQHGYFMLFKFSTNCWMFVFSNYFPNLNMTHQLLDHFWHVNGHL